MDYAWGSHGKDAYIHQLLGSVPATGQPAAELWMGAHPKAPSTLRAPGFAYDGRRLDEAIAADPGHFLGPDLARAGHRQLPFLFKVLDAAEPLSIQAHPDLELAPQLHARDPEHYPDDNHKPELAVCLSGMSALIGFRAPEEIAGYLQRIPELAALCSAAGFLYEPSGEQPGPLPEPTGTETQKRAWIKDAYSRLMRSSPGEIAEAVRAQRLRLTAWNETGDPDDLNPADALFLRLIDIYGEEDRGLFSAYFLNYLDLAPNQALFLGPNEPHAYLGGRILECMAASDNVVRAGLTRKFMDVDTLVEMLHYRYGPPEIHAPEGAPAGTGASCKSSYKVPVQEFEVHRLMLAAGDGIAPQLQLDRSDRPSILLGLGPGSYDLEIVRAEDGGREHGARIPRGRVIYLPGDLAGRGWNVRLRAANDGTTAQEPSYLVYQATVGPDFL